MPKNTSLFVRDRKTHTQKENACLQFEPKVTSRSSKTDTSWFIWMPGETDPIELIYLLKGLGN